MAKRPALTQAPREMKGRSLPWPFPDGRPPSWGKNERVGGGIPKADAQGDGLRYPICRFLKAREEYCRQHGLRLPQFKELMGSYLDASYRDGIPTYEERIADQKALALLAETEGLKSNQYRRKPYAAAVRARSKDGKLPPQMTPEAIRKRKEREAERLAGGKVGKRQLKPLAPDTHSALAKWLCNASTRPSPTAFEKLVLYALSIRYDTSPEETLHTGRPRDGKIDGCIWRSRFGMDDIYIQATLSAVRPWKVRDFHGGILRASDPKQCILVTASTASPSAKAYAKRVGIRIIEGMELAGIMIELGLGVTATKGQLIIDKHCLCAEIDRVGMHWAPRSRRSCIKSVR